MLDRHSNQFAHCLRLLFAVGLGTLVGCGGGSNGGASGGGDATSNPDGGGNSVDCQRACEKKQELCDALDQSWIDTCLEDCKVAVNAEEAIETTLESESCIGTGQFKTPMDEYCSSGEPKEGEEHYDVGWSSVGDVDPLAEEIIDARIVAGPADNPVFFYDYESGEDAPREVHVARWDGSSWTKLGSPITRADEEVRVLDAEVDGEGTPLVLVGESKSSLDAPGVELFAFDGDSWTSVREVGDVPDARLTLSKEGRAVVVSLNEGTLTATQQQSDGTWSTVEYSENVGGGSILVMNTLGGVSIKVAHWPGRDPVALTVDSGPRVFRIAGDGITPVEPNPPEELAERKGYPILAVGLSPDGAPYVAGEPLVDDPEGSGTFGEDYAGYLYKWNGSDWEKVNEDDCLEEPDFALGQPSFQSGDPTNAVDVLSGMEFDATGAPIIWTGGQTSGLYRLADEGRFFSWIGSGSQVSTWDGTRFYGLSLDSEGGATAYQAEP